MAAAYFIVLNSDQPGFDASLDGKALSRNSTRINAIAAKLGFKSLDQYCSQSQEDARIMMASLMELEDAAELPQVVQETLAKMPPEEWYDADDGIVFAKQIAEHIRQNPKDVKEPEAVLYDLNSLITILNQAKQFGLKWHLQVDY